MLVPKYVLLLSILVAGAATDSRPALKPVQRSRQADVAHAPLVPHEVAHEITPLEDDNHKAHLQTNGEAMVNLINNCLGSGMLCMGFALANAGLLASVLCILLSAFVNRYTLHLNLRTCELAGCSPATADVADKAFGPIGRISMVTLYTAFSFICCVSYVVASADAVRGLCSLALSRSGRPLPSSAAITLFCWVSLLLPTTLIRSLRSVATLSFCAFMGGVVLLVSVAVYCASELLRSGLPSLSKLAWLPPSRRSFATALPILLLVFSIQAGGGIVLSEMRDSSEANAKRVSRDAYLIVLGMECAIGLIAYCTFLDKTKGNVLLDFSPYSPVAVVARLALLTLVVLSYMIMMLPCKLSLIDLLFGRNEARMEATPLQFYGTTLAVNLLALAAALCVSDLSLVNGLNGAICTNIVAFLLPAALFLKVRSEPALVGKRGKDAVVAIWSPANAPYFLILIFGVASLAVSTQQMLVLLRS